MVATLSPVLPRALEDRIERVLRSACKADVRLVTAESCTGGLLASILTDVEGCSHAYERGFVTYTDAAKTELLGVPADLLARHGAVSEPVARLMAEGALARSEGDVALSVTGFAGQGRAGDEAGLVHIALARAGASTLHVERHFGDVGRGPVRLRTVEAALDLLESALS